MTRFGSRMTLHVFCFPKKPIFRVVSEQSSTFIGGIPKYFSIYFIVKSLNSSSVFKMFPKLFLVRKDIKHQKFLATLKAVPCVGFTVFSLFLHVIVALDYLKVIKIIFIA